MLLNIQAITNLLAQVVSSNTFLVALITFDGRLVAYHLHPNAILEDDDQTDRTSSDGSDQAKIVAAIASGLWRQECYERSLSAPPSKSDSTNHLRHLDAICELGQLRISLTHPFLLVLVAKTGLVSLETLSIKSQLLQDYLNGPFSSL